jgi:hypothetical protein
MDKAIAVVKMPNENAGRMVWRAFDVAIASFESKTGATRLGENAWRIELENPAALAKLFAACDQLQFSYGILPLDGEQRWLLADKST